MPPLGKDQDSWMPSPAVATDWADWVDEEEPHTDEQPGQENEEQGPLAAKKAAGRPRAQVEEGFDPSYFVGDWLDNLGHKVLVVPGNPPRGSSRRRNNNGRTAFLATLSKAGVPDKRFNISKDRGKRDWTCGNGVLVREESSMEVLVWRAGDGRMSTWSRTPPEGPVYFDAAPEGTSAFLGPEDSGALQEPAYFDAQPKDPTRGQPQGPPIFFDPPPEAAQEQWMHPGAAGAYYFVVQQPLEWKELRLPADDDEQAADRAEAADQAEAAAGEGDAAPASGSGAGLNPAAPEFVPSWGPSKAADAAVPAPEPTLVPTSAASTPAPSPELGAAPVPRQQRIGYSPRVAAAPSPVLSRASWGRTPTPSPMLGPLPPPDARHLQGLLPAPAVLLAPAGPVTVEVCEESSDARAEGNHLEWSLPDLWGKLRSYPKDNCLISPMFSVRRCPNMQLAFYPNGSRAAEAGQCTVGLTRGPDCAGIKFEIKVNGRSLGPKVCLGRRYLGDYPKPFNDSEESETGQINVCMQVLEFVGAPD